MTRDGRVPLTRERLMRELGLGPEWLLRSSMPQQDMAAPAAEAREMASEEAPEEARSGRPVAERTPEVARATMRPVADSTRDESVAVMDWSALKSTVTGCERCGLCKSRKNTVFGVGDERAEWLIVGEAPGAEEDARGEPFVGQAGRLLDNMLASVDLTRGDNVYIANVLKCRPPNNRNPSPEEVAQCSPFLRRQLALLRPRLVLAMGRFAVQTLLQTDASIASLRGQVHQYAGVPLVATYHPAYLLRTLPDKAKAWDDLLLARRTMAALPPRAS